MPIQTDLYNTNPQAPLLGTWLAGFRRTRKNSVEPVAL